ncbi:hypothetical protein SAMN05216567_109152 [Variovorax sp. OK605]|jgi:hypothetical protein|uniref:hypothetical protein n=1 Tax=Variovorax sp. OK605 TaxID=1855317 RepID=UPI0008E849E9|nr:hypothetical protein [Variovorax sp. OK605]SFP85590.1 hypothetical protein SAMN05216567_109152 [Variovorax sp. OK605]
MRTTKEVRLCWEYRLAVDTAQHAVSTGWMADTPATRAIMEEMIGNIGGLTALSRWWTEERERPAG